MQVSQSAPDEKPLAGPDEKRLDDPPGTSHLAFYRDDYVLLLDENGKILGWRANVVRDAGGQVQWFRTGGRLNRKVS
jgi:hypothetical protein